jgi:hypothetical protein
MVHPHSSTASQRVQWVSELLAHEGTYGMVSRLHQSNGVSRQTLYTWKAKGQRALEAVFSPEPSQGSSPIERAILTLLVQAHASYRDIQACLKELLGLDVSLGTIVSIVQSAGERAQAWLQQQGSSSKRLLALDEQYSSKRGEAYLSVVDAHSSQVWAALPPVAVDGESWTLALWALQEQGVSIGGSVSDGGKAIADALSTTGLLGQHQRDVWHLLHLAGQAQARLQRLVDEEEQRWVTIERQEQSRLQTGRRPSGRPAKTTAQAQEHQLIILHRVLVAVSYLFAQLRQLLEIVAITDKREPRLLCYEQRRAEIETLLVLLQEAVEPAPPDVQKEVHKVSRQITLALPALLHFAQQMQVSEQEAKEPLGDAAVGLIAWAWQRRASLLEPQASLLDLMEPAWRAGATPLLQVWEQAVRARSVVENWHSSVRPHLAVHRSLSAGMLALLAVWHNHRVAPRGPHAGCSPLQRSGLPHPAADWLEVLGYAPLAA